jgi:hypothetical protein
MAAVVVAAQLGVGDVLGIIGWAGPHDERAWLTLLTWIAFSFSFAVLVGALVGRAAIQRVRGRDGIGSRVVSSLVAAAGAAAVIGLAWLPSREIHPPVNANAGLVISLTAGAGVLVGLVLAVLALSVRAVATGLLTTAVWVWLLAIGAAVVGLTTGESYPTPRLAIPDAPSLIPPSTWTGPLVMVVVAAVLGLVVSAIARGQGSTRLAAGISGFGGPALVAAAYLIAGPGDAQSEPYLAALLAVAAGLAASAVVAIPTRAATPAGGKPRRSGPSASRESAPAPARESARSAPAAESEAPAGDVLVTTRTPVSASTSAPARPAWAEGSGPFARAYTSSASHATEPEATPTITRGTGWDADTLHGPTHGSADQPDSGGGIYRSSAYGAGYESAAARPAVGAGVMGQPAIDPHESWLRDLGGSGRHAAE